MTDATQRVLGAVEAGWRPLRRAAAHLGEEGLEMTTTAGWTAKELLAHVAFWDEAVLGVVVGMFRGQALPDGWTFGSGYLPGEGEDWPRADEHNAREAGWARRRSGSEVLARLDAAHEQLLVILSTVTEQEVSEHADYFDQLGAHYAEHQPELEALMVNGR